jgi:hypothetical protein
MGTFMGASDIGEMFLNFMLEENCACLEGVDLTHYMPKGETAGEGRRHLVRWNRCLMGGTFSPYQTGKGMGHAKEMIMGDPNDCSDVFQWKEVRLNLPGVEDYDPSLSWVSKIREDGRVAADLFIYMDDLRPTGPDAEECWRAARKGEATCNHLGIQDAPRKRRAASKTPGPWAGSMIYTDDEDAGLRVLVARKKWCNAKRLLANLYALPKESEMVDHKVLERTRGFLVYVERTNKPMTPFLLGFHLTIDSWRPGRDEEGWRLRQAEVEASLESDDESDTEEGHGGEERAPPTLVLAVPRLRDDLNVLIQLTEAEAPPLR